MDKLIIISLILFSTLFTSCGDEPKRATYYPTERDTLSFLVNNSDLIAVVQIIDGSSENYGGIKEKRYIQKAKAKIKELLKGEIQKDLLITISSSPIHNRPGAIQTTIYLRNGEYIAFLAKSGGTYKPLTFFSLIEVDSNRGRPIWKQTDSKYIDVPEIPKHEIIKEIKNAIEPLAAVGPG